MKTQTTTPKTKEIKRDWHFINVEDKILGRAATEITKLLIGKHKPMYSTHINVGDKVVVTNAAKIRVTGKKLQDKVYKWHTGYPGGIKEETLGDKLNRTPEKVLFKAVERMLPKNKLQQERLNNLYIYAGEEHPHKGQEVNSTK